MIKANPKPFTFAIHTSQRSNQSRKLSGCKSASAFPAQITAFQAGFRTAQAQKNKIKKIQFRQLVSNSHFG